MSREARRRRGPPGFFVTGAATFAGKDGIANGDAAVPAFRNLPAKLFTMRNNTPSRNETTPTALPVRRGPFYALGFRNFRLFFFGQMISVAGSWMQSVAEQWLIFSLTHSAAWLGIVAGSSALPYVAFTMWGGQVADRFSRRTILVVTQGAALLLAVLLAVLASNRVVRIQPWHVAALAGLLGVVNAFNVPAQQAFVTDMIDGSDALPNAIALNSFQFNIARVIGPIIAGSVLVSLGVPWCFGLNALSFAAVILSLLLMRLPPHKLREVGDRASSLWEGFRYIGRSPSVLRIIMMVGFGSMLLWSIWTLYPVFAERYHQGPKGFSRMMTANGIGAATGGILVAAFGERLSRRHLIYGGAALFALTMIAMTLAPSFPVLLCCLVFSGLCMMLLGVNANTRIQQEVPNRLRGRVMAVYSLVFGGLMPFGGLTIGFLAKHIGAPEAVRIYAGIALVAAISLFLWSEFDRRPRLPEMS